MLVIFAILPSICVYVCTHIDMLLLSYCTILKQHLYIHLIEYPAKYWVRILTRK
jgi:hypothetical protein